MLLYSLWETRLWNAGLLDKSPSFFWRCLWHRARNWIFLSYFTVCCKREAKWYSQWFWSILVNFYHFIKCKEVNSIIMATIQIIPELKVLTLIFYDIYVIPRDWYCDLICGQLKELAASLWLYSYNLVGHDLLSNNFVNPVYILNEE